METIAQIRESVVGALSGSAGEVARAYFESWPVRLAEAADGGNESELRALLADVPAGRSVDERVSGGRTPLMLGSWQAYTGAVGVLLAAGADPDARDDLGRTPRNFGCLRKRVARARAREAAALIEAYGGEREVPRRFDVKLTAARSLGGRTSARRNSVRTAADAFLLDAFSVRVHWRRGGVGLVWLYAVEEKRFRWALAEAAEVNEHSFELTPEPAATG